MSIHKEQLINPNNIPTKSYSLSIVGLIISINILGGSNNDQDCIYTAKIIQKGFRYLIVLHASLLIINILSPLNSYPMSCYSITYMYCMDINA